MFDLHEITLTNFRSYRGTHEFIFPDTAGLYYLAGENQAEPSLGANGAGKSTFLDAIIWVLFGRTSRGLKANDVITWGDNTAAVSLVLTIGDQKAQIQRTQKPNGLFLNTKPVDQEELEKFLRLNFESFKYSILNPQFTTAFFSLSPSDKLTLFSDIQNLNFWLDKSKDAALLADQQQTSLSKLVGTIDSLDGQIVIIKEDIIDLKTLAASFEADKKDKLKQLMLEITAFNTESAELKSDIKRIREDHYHTLDEYRHVELALDKLKSMRDKELDRINEWTQNKRNLQFSKNEVSDQICEINSSNGGHCETCGQALNLDDVEHRLLELQSKLADIEQAILLLKEMIKGATTEIASLRGKINTKEVELDEIQSLQRKLTKEDGAAKYRKAFVEHNLAATAKAIEALDTSTNPHEQMLADKRQKLLSLKTALTEASQKHEQLEADHEATKFWIKGFKRVRLFIIEEAFRTLEVEVNNSLAQLGMADWQITFDIERENKSGGITKGFVVFIKSPRNAEPVKWENWSGGETQRLQLAGDLGLANLIMQRAGLRSRIEFFDEPSMHLSPEGMMDLANLLHERAVEEGKRIWIVDHASITNFGNFEGIITARKTENGSSITVTSSQT